MYQTFYDHLLNTVKIEVTCIFVFISHLLVFTRVSCTCPVSSCQLCLHLPPPQPIVLSESWTCQFCPIWVFSKEVIRATPRPLSLFRTWHVNRLSHSVLVCSLQEMYAASGYSSLFAPSCSQKWQNSVTNQKNNKCRWQVYFWKCSRFCTFEPRESSLEFPCWPLLRAVKCVDCSKIKTFNMTRLSMFFGELDEENRSTIWTPRETKKPHISTEPNPQKRTVTFLINVGVQCVCSWQNETKPCFIETSNTLVYAVAAVMYGIDSYLGSAFPSTSSLSAPSVFLQNTSERKRVSKRKASRIPRFAQNLNRHFGKHLRSLLANWCNSWMCGPCGPRRKWNKTCCAQMPWCPKTHCLEATNFIHILVKFGCNRT